MVELWLNFKDENGKPKRILVEGEKFTMGRTSENDLSIPLSNLSREHARIDRFADIFVLADCGSSNGTSFNGEKMSDPIAIKNGDKFNLGGGLEIEAELISDEEDANASGSGGASDDDENDEEDEQGAAAGAGGAAANSAGSSSGSGGGGMSFGFFILAPILCIVLLLIGGGIFLMSGLGNTQIAKVTPTPYSGTPRKSETPVTQETDSPSGGQSPSPENSSTPDLTPTPNAGTTPVTTPTDDSPPDGPTQPPQTGSRAKIISASKPFLRKIAATDPNAFLTMLQLNSVESALPAAQKITALADNIKNAKQNAAKIQEVAQSKNLRPQFLAVAALTDLGNQRGDVLARATEMAPILADLTQKLSNEFFDDMLLVMAAYDDAKAGEKTKMFNLLISLKDLTPDAKKLRSVWFLHDHKKITDNQFEKAMRFLAVGTITQNPKDFNVNAEALSFD